MPAAATGPIATLLLLCSIAGPAAAAELRPYGHPDLDLRFSAPPGWRHRPRPGDEGTHERVDPETGIHVLMWGTSTESAPGRYLAKMAGMMGLRPEGEPRAWTVDGSEARILAAAGDVDGQAVRTLLAVIPAGRSARHPFEREFRIVQIWCPAADHPRLAARMEELLGTVRLTDRLELQGRLHRLYPETRESPPDLPSPCRAATGETCVIVRTRDGRFALVPVTVEDGAPNDYDRGEWGKGRQLAVDARDFPALARSGLHDEAELAGVAAITGRAVADITRDARPGRASRTGFLAADEELLAVIRSDNRLVAALGLTHPQLARPLFHVFNLILRDLELYRRGLVPARNIAGVLHDGHEIRIEASAGKGWQESVFADEVQGYWSIELRREPTWLERRHLERHHGRLGAAGLDELAGLLTTIRTGEMVPFYIMRYGFYEGRVPYRADPLAIACLFGLASLETIDAATGGDLPGTLTRHHAP
jgi:hypothetical protein